SIPTRRRVRDNVGTARRRASPDRVRGRDRHVRARVFGTMPRRPAEDTERWRHVVTELIDVVVDALLDYAPDRAMADVTDEEIKARGIVALRDLNARQNGARVDAPSQWGWGRNRWSNLVRQALCRRARHGTRRRSDEEAAAFLAALQARGEPRQNPPSEAPAPTPQRVRDDKSPDHPGLQLFEGVFSDSDVIVIE
ncbi:hypothetical protein BE221DRAFT_70144, partial [Ostreococcus tauri]